MLSIADQPDPEDPIREIPLSMVQDFASAPMHTWVQPESDECGSIKATTRVPTRLSRTPFRRSMLEGDDGLVSGQGGIHKPPRQPPHRRFRAHYDRSGTA